MAARCATGARSITSCAFALESIANPVWRQFITSEWSPKMESACVPTVRDATCRTPGRRSPEMRCMTGIMSMSPCDEVKDVESAPASSEPWIAPIAPASDCISTSVTVWPNTFLRPFAAHSSVFPAIGEDGVIG